MERVVFGTALIGAIGVIVSVHYQQKYDKARMHEGVLRDKERQRQKLRLKEQEGS
jgi:protein PET117